MNTENETVADIRKEAEARFRELLEKHVDSLGHIQAMQQFNQAFDRIDAAAKRESVTNCNHLGNAAKLREALMKLDKWLYIGVDGYVHSQPNKAYEIERTIKSALSAPPRQCDVGTAEEQTARYDKFCYTNRTVEKCCADCPALGIADCEFTWAQMPYTESEVGK